MDPTQCLAEIESELRACHIKCDIDSAHDALGKIADLIAWICRGGFYPNGYEGEKGHKDLFMALDFYHSYLVNAMRKDRV